MGVKISRLYYIDRRKDEFVILRWHRLELTATWCPSIDTAKGRADEFAVIEESFKRSISEFGVRYSKRRTARHRCGMETGEFFAWKRAA